MELRWLFRTKTVNTRYFYSICIGFLLFKGQKHKSCYLGMPCTEYSHEIWHRVSWYHIDSSPKCSSNPYFVPMLTFLEKRYETLGIWPHESTLSSRYYILYIILSITLYTISNIILYIWLCIICCILLYILLYIYIYYTWNLRYTMI